MGSEEFGDFMVNEEGEVIDKFEMEAFTKEQEEDVMKAIKRAREIRQEALKDDRNRYEK